MTAEPDYGEVHQDPVDLYQRVTELEHRVAAAAANSDRRSKQFKYQVLFIAIGGLLGLAFVAYHGEVNTNSIRDSRYQACVARNQANLDYQKGREDVVRSILELTPQAPQRVKDAVLKNLAANLAPQTECVR